MPDYFKNNEGTEIAGGEFSGDGSGEQTFFSDGKRLKITGGRFSAGRSSEAHRATLPPTCSQPDQPTRQATGQAHHHERSHGAAFSTSRQGLASEPESYVSDFDHSSSSVKTISPNIPTSQITKPTPLPSSYKSNDGPAQHTPHVGLSLPPQGPPPLPPKPPEWSSDQSRGGSHPKTPPPHSSRGTGQTGYPSPPLTAKSFRQRPTSGIPDIWNQGYQSSDPPPASHGYSQPLPRQPDTAQYPSPGHSPPAPGVSFPHPQVRASTIQMGYGQFPSHGGMPPPVHPAVNYRERYPASSIPNPHSYRNGPQVGMLQSSHSEPPASSHGPSSTTRAPMMNRSVTMPIPHSTHGGHHGPTSPPYNQHHAPNLHGGQGLGYAGPPPHPQRDYNNPDYDAMPVVDEQAPPFPVPRPHIP